MRGPRRWAYQAFRSLPRPVRDAGDAVLRARAELEVRAQPTMGHAPVRLLIGPANTAGQGLRWARAVRERVPGADARNLAVQDRKTAAGMAFGQDIWLSGGAQLRGLRAHRERVLGTGDGPGATHVLSESARPVLGDFHNGSVLDDLPELCAAGIVTGLVFHGSEVRPPSEHADRYPHSPFQGEPDAYVERLAALASRSRTAMDAFDGPVFVSTPDLLDFAPRATWLPLVVDVDRFATARPALQSARPVVLHAPSNPRLKGTEAVEAALTGLHDDGLVVYRRLTGVPHADMPGFVAEADVVVDQVVLGNPGVLLAEAMAAGRVAVAHLAADVVGRMRAADPGGEEPPVVQASPADVGAVVERIARERAAYQEVARRGPAWARRNHDGSRAAAVLGGWLRPAG